MEVGCQPRWALPGVVFRGAPHIGHDEVRVAEADVDGVDDPLLVVGLVFAGGADAADVYTFEAPRDSLAASASSALADPVFWLYSFRCLIPPFRKWLVSCRAWRWVGGDALVGILEDVGHLVGVNSDGKVQSVQPEGFRIRGGIHKHPGDRGAGHGLAGHVVVVIHG